MSEQPHAVSADQPVPLKADELIDAAKARVQLDQLLQLDGFWTREARLATQDLPDRDERISGLGLVVDEMDRLAGEIKEMLPRVRDILQSHSSEIAQRFAAIIDPGSLTGTRLAATMSAKHQEALRAYVEQKAHGDISVLLADSVAILMDRLDAERQALADEFRRLREGGQSDGDLSEDVHHAAWAVEAGLAMAGQPELAVLVEVGVQVAECLGL